MKSLADQGVKGKIPPWEGINIYGTKPRSLARVGLLGHHIKLSTSPVLVSW